MTVVKPFITRSTRRLQALGRALLLSDRQHPSRCPPTAASNSCCSGSGSGEVESNTNLTLEQQIFVFDLQGFLVIEDVLSPAAVRHFNKLIDARGIAPGTAEELAADGSAGSKVRFGSNGGGTKNTGPGLLDWGQPFIDLLDHPTVVPLLSALMPRSDGLGTVGAGIRLDRLYGIHQDRVSSGILPTGTGLGGFHRDYEGTYAVKNGVVQNSFIVAAWALSDSGGALTVPWQCLLTDLRRRRLLIACCHYCMLQASMAALSASLAAVRFPPSLAPCLSCR